METGMMQPQKAPGDQAMADVNMKLCMDMMTNTLPMYGSDSQKGQVVLDVLRKLSKEFGQKMGEAKQLTPMEIQSLTAAAGGGAQSPLAGGAPPPGGAPPGMQ